MSFKKKDKCKIRYPSPFPSLLMSLNIVEDKLQTHHRH